MGREKKPNIQLSPQLKHPRGMLRILGVCSGYGKTGHLWWSDKSMMSFNRIKTR